MFQQRSIATCIILSLVTCGIYGIYWFICLTNDTNSLLGRQDTSGGTAFLLTLVTCGIYGYYWAYKQGQKIDELRVARGLTPGNNSVLYIILQIFSLGIVNYALMQNEINNLI